MTHLEGIAHQIAREARIAANCAAPGWAYSVAIPRSLFLGEMPQTKHVCSHPTRSTKLGEIVRIDLNFLNDVTNTTALKLLLRMELEPFIIGVGKVRAIEDAKGLILMSCEEGKGVDITHFYASSTSETPAPSV